MSTTAVTLLNGRVLQVAGQYDDMRVYLTTGQRREVTLVDGSKIDLATGLVGLIEQAQEQQQQTVGFR